MVTYFGNEDPVINLKAQQKCANAFPGGVHRIIKADHNILTTSFFNN